MPPASIRGAPAARGSRRQAGPRATRWHPRESMGGHGPEPSAMPRLLTFGKNSADAMGCGHAPKASMTRSIPHIPTDHALTERRYRWARAYRDGEMVCGRVDLTVMADKRLGLAPCERRCVAARFLERLDPALRTELAELVVAAAQSPGEPPSACSRSRSSSMTPASVASESPAASSRRSCDTATCTRSSSAYARRRHDRPADRSPVG